MTSSSCLHGSSITFLEADDATHYSTRRLILNLMSVEKKNGT